VASSSLPATNRKVAVRFIATGPLQLVNDKRRCEQKENLDASKCESSTSVGDE